MNPAALASTARAALSLPPGGWRAAACGRWVGLLGAFLGLALPPPAARGQTPPPALFTTLHSFGAGADGLQPQAALLLGQDGNYYGTTRFGGTNRVGTIFLLTPAGGYTVLLSFDAPPEDNGDNQDGTNPSAPLIQDAAGNLFGTTTTGGATNDGTVFRATTTGDFTKLHDLGSQQPGFTDGAFPNGGLAFLPDGTVAGVAMNGGDSNSDGVVFFFGGDNGFSALNLGGDTGMSPIGSLAVAPSGFIWSFVGSKANPCWVWIALCRQTRQVVAYFHRRSYGRKCPCAA